MHKSIAFVGDVTIDNYPKLGEKRFGGTSFNSAMWALRAGAKDISIIAPIGSDENGKLFLDKIRKEKIHAGGVRILHGETSSIEVFVDSKTHERSFKNWRAGVQAYYHFGKKEFTLLSTHAAMSMSIYGKTEYMLSELSVWVKKTKKRPLIVVNFNNLKEVENPRKVIADAVDCFDIGFFGLNKKEDESIISYLKTFAKKTDKLMVITMGEHGTFAQKGSKTFSIPAPKVPHIVDTTGAGDAFLAGFIVQYLKTQDIQGALIAGTNIAARKLQLFGAC